MTTVHAENVDMKMVHQSVIQSANVRILNRRKSNFHNAIKEQELEEEKEMAKNKQLDNLSNADVFCPFYKGTEHQQVIRCEGPVDNTALRLGFAGKKKCQTYMEEYCNTKECEKCRIYLCVMMKYEDAQ